MTLRLPLFVCALGVSLGAAAPVRAQGEVACQGPKSETSIDVVVEKVRSAKGLIAVTLYADDSHKFLVKHGSMYVERVPAAPVTRMCLYVPKPGVYAIAIYHDENANGKFDRGGIIGLPLEGYGFSNNPPTFFSLPSFNSVRVSIPHSGLTTTIRLKYP
jgi:uncharacterized protein (DUF2141 family)